MDECTPYTTDLYAFIPRGVCVYGARQQHCLEIHQDQIQKFIEVILHNFNYQLHE